MTSHDLKATYPAPEKLAAGLTAAVFLLSIISRAVGWDWLFDTAFLLAGAYLVLAGNRATVPTTGSGDATLYVAVYLFLDSVLQTFVDVCFPSWRMLFHLALAGLYGVAVAALLRRRGFAVSRFDWSRLFQRPLMLTTVSVLVPLVCLYMPMLHFYHPWKVWTGPMVVYLPGTMHMSAGRVVDWGYEAVHRGIEVTFSRAACLLLAGIGAALVLRIAAMISAAGSLRFMRVAAVLVCVWWLFPAKGYGSLNNVFDLIFVFGCAGLLLLLFGQKDLAPSSGSSTPDSV